MMEKDPPDAPAVSDEPDAPDAPDTKEAPGAPPESGPPGSLPADAELVDLVRRAVSGKKDAQRLLCERQLPLFQQVAARLTYRFRDVTKETARQEELDILHHIVCAFMEDLRNANGVVARWRPEQGSLPAWLRPFATCRGLDLLRKRKDRNHLSLESMAAAIEVDLLHLHQAKARGAIDVAYREALTKLCELIVNDPSLGPDALKLLERIFWYEEDRKLVAASLGINRNTLDVQIIRLRKSLLKLSQGLGLPFLQARKKTP